MQVIGELNKLSPQLQKLIKPLKPGELGRWQRTVSHTLHELDRDMAKKKGKVFPHMQIFAKDSIYDPWGGGVDSDGNGIGAPVDIGIVAKGGYDFSKKEVSKWQDIIFERNITGSEVILDGKNPLHREIHEFFQLSNINGKPVHGSEHRNPEVDVLIIPIDPKSEASKKTKRFSTKLQVLQHVELMEVDAMRELAAGLGWDYTAPQEELVAQLMEYADKEPEALTQAIGDPQMKIKAKIKYALMEGRLKFDSVQYRMLYPDGTVIVNMERVKGESEVDAFARWLSTAPNAEHIIKQLGKRAKAAA